MIWFLIGAVLACIQTAMVRNSLPFDYPVQTLAFVAAMGTATFGTVLWLVMSLFFGVTWP